MNQDYLELCERVKLYRIYYPLTQAELAAKSGVSVRSISRFENGEDIGLSNFLKILRALDLKDQLTEMIPDQRVRPSYYLTKERKRSRASGDHGSKRGSSFVWGEDK